MTELLVQPIEQPTRQAPELFHRRIEPRRFAFPTMSDWNELFSSRDLIMVLVSRDLASRYRRAVLGGLWAILQPLMTVMAFSFVINRVMRLPSDGLPYMLYVWSAMILWQFISGAILASSSQTSSMAQLVNKVYFPRLTLPVAALGRPLADLGINTVLVLLGTVLIFHIPLSLNLLWMPMFVLLAAISTLGILCWTSALCAVFYDFAHLIPFVMQLLFIACPVMYSIKSAPATWSIIYYLNPVAAAVAGFRWSIVGAGMPPSEWHLLSFAAALIIAATGILFYFHVSRWFADLL